jgi:hypothetical protein
MNRVDIIIVRDDVVSGLIRGNITYTIERDSITKKVTIHGEAYELMVPAQSKEIYSHKNEDINEESVFDIVIKRNGKKNILKDVFIWPRPSSYLVGKDIVVIDNFKFRSW